jgi:hypothetical protein
MTVIEIRNENKELQKQGKPWIFIDRKVVIEWKDWEIIKDKLKILEARTNWNSTATETIWKVINKVEKDWRHNQESDDWEKGFREGANHSFSFLNSGADLSDKFVNKEIKELDSELKNRIKIATGKGKVSSVLNEK